MDGAKGAWELVLRGVQTFSREDEREDEKVLEMADGDCTTCEWT